MKNRHTSLTLPEACTLLARECVSLLDAGSDARASAGVLRDALALVGPAQEPEDGGALLRWVDAEMENAGRFEETGERAGSPVRLETPLPLPDPAMQLEAVCVLLQAAARRSCTPAQWQTMLNAVNILAEMDGLEDMILDAHVPAAGFLRPETLRSSLEHIRAAFPGDTPYPQRAVSRVQPDAGPLLSFPEAIHVCQGRKPASAILHGREVVTPTWKSVGVAILRDCNADPVLHERMMALRGCPVARGRAVLEGTPERMRRPVKIDEAMYWENRGSMEEMLRALVKGVLNKVGYDTQAIMIRLRDGQEVAAADSQERNASHRRGSGEQTAGGLLLPLTAQAALFKGQKAAAVVLRGEEIPAGTWKTVVAAILKDCDADPVLHERMMDLRGRVLGRFRVLLSDTPEGMGMPVEVNSELYWESKFDTEALLANLTEKLLQVVGYDCRQVQIRLRAPQMAYDAAAPVMEDPEPENMALSAGPVM